MQREKFGSKTLNIKKMTFKDSYNLKNLPLQIDRLEKQLKECETILNTLLSLAYTHPLKH